MKANSATKQALWGKASSQNEAYFHHFNITVLSNYLKHSTPHEGLGWRQKAWCHASYMQYGGEWRVLDLLGLFEECLWFAGSTFSYKAWDSHCSGLGLDWVLPCLGLDLSQPLEVLGLPQPWSTLVLVIFRFWRSWTQCWSTIESVSFGIGMDHIGLEQLGQSAL